MNAFEIEARIVAIQDEIKQEEIRIGQLVPSEIEYRSQANAPCNYNPKWEKSKLEACKADRAYKLGVANQRASQIAQARQKIARLTEELNTQLDARKAESQVAVNLSKSGTSYQATLIEAQAKAEATNAVAQAQVNETVKSAETDALGKKMMFGGIALAIAIFLFIVIKIIKSKFA